MQYCKIYCSTGVPVQRSAVVCSVVFGACSEVVEKLRAYSAVKCTGTVTDVHCSGCSAMRFSEV